MATETWTGESCPHGFPVEYKTQCPECMAVIASPEEEVEEFTGEIETISKKEKKAPPPVPKEVLKKKAEAEAERISEIRTEVGIEKETAKNIIGESLKSEPHEKNQDAFAIGDNYALVADGLGGEAGGFEASHTIVETIKSIEGDINAAVASKDQQNIEALLNHAIDASAQAVSTTGAMRAGTEKLGSTMSMLIPWQTPEKKGFMGIGKQEAKDKISYAQIGDSRIYRIRGESMDLITKDQSITQLLIDAKIFPDDQSMETTYTLAELEQKIKGSFEEGLAQALIAQIDRKLISKAAKVIEEGQFKEVDGQLTAAFSVENIREIVTSAITADPKTTTDRQIGTMDAEKGDIYIISSDGLHDNLLDSEIYAIARHWKEDPEKMNELLVMAAKVRMGEKNINSVPELKPLLKDDSQTAKRAKSDDISVVTKII